jgi:hypothetical protein
MRKHNLKPPEGFGVGSPIWIFDENRRVYPPKAPGDLYAIGGPIYREHWVRTEVESETRRTWTVKRYGAKIAKKGPWYDVAFSEADFEALVWVEENMRKIVNLIESCPYPDIIRKIWAILNPTTHKEGGEF